MAEKYIYLRMIKEWGGFRVGDVVRFGMPKGGIMIEKGYGVKVKKQAAVNDTPSEIKKPTIVETADMPPPPEKAVVTPMVEKKENVKPESTPKDNKDKEKGGAD